MKTYSIHAHFLLIICILHTLFAERIFAFVPQITNIHFQRTRRNLPLHSTDERTDKITSDFDSSKTSIDLQSNNDKKKENAIKSDGPSTYSPAAQFGKPLSSDISNFNKAAISFIKNSVFDALFPTTNESTSSSEIAQPRQIDYARFYALETIARMPYFAYLSVLHLYETLGWFRKANYLKLHFAESWNELHHLLIMEELGGNEKWKDRFVAQHTAFFYYWFIVSIYLFNPILAYNLNHAVEEHAYETYNTFLNQYELFLKSKEAPDVAKEYYTGDDVYLLREMQTNQYKCEQGKIQNTNVRSIPVQCETLYDMFCAIRDDEAEHVKTMEFLQNQSTDIDLILEDGITCEVDPDNLMISTTDDTLHP